jgi:hypothetical protein
MIKAVKVTEQSPQAIVAPGLSVLDASRRSFWWINLSEQPSAHTVQAAFFRDKSHEKQNGFLLLLGTTTPTPSLLARVNQRGVSQSREGRESS